MDCIMSAPSCFHPRIGIPYRTRKEELTPGSDKLDRYLDAVRKAGGDPVAVSLALSPEELSRLADTLNGVVLSGSPADVDPSLFHSGKHIRTAAADADREKTDFALLEHALATHKPLLAICYGVQSLNVFLGGTLIQDIPDELRTPVLHDHNDGEPDAFHGVSIEAESRLARMAGSNEARVNSSHHQSIREPGHALHIVARASDGVIEAVEWTGDSDWVTGVQWHPERMYDSDALAQSLFGGLVAAARDMRTPAQLAAGEHSLSR
jgi:putative glutamine amidotransferase